MRRLTHLTQADSTRPAESRRGGAALIVVLAMTGMLMFLGFFFFSYISAERNSAAWFALSANQEVAEGDYFDFALGGVIIGPPDDLKNSALSGRKYSLLPNMLGTFGPDLKPTDLHPYTGRGIHVRYDGDNSGDGTPQSEDFHFDYNGDGTDTAQGETTVPSERRIINFSPAANPVVDGSDLIPFTPLGQVQHPDYVPDFEPDAGYTYPDINSMFLGYFALVPDPTFSPGDPDYLKRVWIPSFHRPQYLPRSSGTPLYTDSAYRNRVLRPHRESRVELRRFDTGSSTQQRVYRRRYVDAGGFDTTFTNAAAGPSVGFDFTAPSEGIWHGVANHANISYDADADGIAANGEEAILLDLDHRVEVMSDGSRRIPMFYITIMDADGLLNLNSAGNLYGEDTTLAHTRGVTSGPDTNAFGNGRFITKSNLGLSGGEVNLGRAFYRALEDSGSGLTLPSASMGYEDMFKYNRTSNQVTQVDQANMELARLLLGAGDDGTDGVDPVPGRWGEVNLLEPAIAATSNPPSPPIPRVNWPSPNFPAPGRAAYDDNDNYLTGGGKTQIAGSNSEDPIFGPLGIGIPSGVHPIDMTGVGLNFFGTGESNTFATEKPTDAIVLNDAVYTAQGTAAAHGKLRTGLQPEPNNPSRWPSYSNRWEMQASPSVLTTMSDSTGVVPWYNTTPTMGALQATTTGGADNLFLADEPDEAVIENALRDLTYDAHFSIAEMSFLQNTQTDYGKSKVESRLQKLVTYNFDHNFDIAGTANFNDGWWLRSQFTTDSYDRWEFAMAPAIGAKLDPADADFDTTRGWEFNPLGNDSTRLIFPPEFGGADAGRFERNDPFRPEVRQWLMIERNRDESFSNFPLPQRRLNINRLLEKDSRGNFVERHLTPHPVIDASDSDSGGILDLMYDATNSVVINHETVPSAVSFANIGTNKFVREWWAKYDRQRLARDIYVLLYTMGHGDHSRDVTSEDNSSFALYTEQQCAEMAQFAVNYVDALDRDDVITEFVYDTNLADGWNITGEKSTTTGLFVGATASQTRSVFGVEAQQLSISETLWAAFNNSQTSDSGITPWDDTTGQPPIHFFFMELRNASPKLAPYGDGTWRIRRVVNEDDYLANRDDGIADETDDVVATFKTAGAIPGVEGGANFWIGSHSFDDDAMAAIIAVDDNEDGQYDANEIFCPSRLLQTNTDLKPTCDLDLCHIDHESFFEESSETKGYFLDGVPVAGTPPTFTIVLERRINMQGNGQLDSPSANPWVPVDYMEVLMNGNVSDLLDTTTGDLQLSTLNNATSQERREPFTPHAEDDTHIAETNGRSHSFGPDTPLAFNDPIYDPYIDANDALQDLATPGITTFRRWQPHFDRDYVGIFELLALPIVGPDELTDKLAEGNSLSGLNTAMAKFTVPDPNTTDLTDNNAWYRILELLEVPTAVQAHIKDELPMPRTPGKVNLNSIRHPGVLAALIDDDFHLDSFRTPAQVIADSDSFKAQYPYLQLQDPHEAERHWYEQFVLSRDRIDPVTSLPLPGIPGSRPFRPFSYVNADNSNLDGQASVEHTLLRSLPFGTGPMPENMNGIGVPGSNWARTDTATGTEQAINRRGLFEARTSADALFPGTGVNAVDFHTRLRLLNKIANNTTVRSHLFFCWIEVHFHEAAEDEYGNAQVGGDLSDNSHPLHDSPSAGVNDPKRGFFVIDRSKLEEAYDSRTGKFDWRKLVVYRSILQ